MNIRIVSFTRCSGGTLQKKVPVFYTSTGFFRCLSTEQHPTQSIVDKFSPKIRSPFDNPRRTGKIVGATEAVKLSNVEELHINKLEGSGVEKKKQVVPELRDDIDRKNDEKSISDVDLAASKPIAIKATRTFEIKRLESIMQRVPVILLNGMKPASYALVSQKDGVAVRSVFKSSPRIAETMIAEKDMRVVGNFRAFCGEEKERISTKFMKRLGIAAIDRDLPDAEKKKLRMERNTRIGLLFLVTGATVTLILFSIYYGRSKRSETGVIVPDKYSGSLLAPAYRIADGFREWFNYAVEPVREKLLPDPLKPPYVQPKYTLVIEMKNVLVSPEWTYKTGHRFKKRPALDYFLEVAGYPNFELVIYTSESLMTAFGVVDQIDTKQRIMYRLFRDCTKYTGGHYVKDLNRLNRDLSKVIFIDFDPQSAKYNPENLLRLPKWDGDMDDTALVDLAELLKTISSSNVEDVRPILQFYSGFDDPTSEFRRRAVQLSDMQRQEKENQQSQSRLRKYTGFLGARRHNV